MRVINNIIDFSNENFTTFKKEMTNLFDEGLKYKIEKENGVIMNES
jgi:hypothetical protein